MYIKRILVGCYNFFCFKEEEIGLEMEISVLNYLVR